MGRIRTTLVKRVGQRLVKENPDLFKADFEYNKQKITEKLEFNSKKLRNVIAGYVTQLTKETQKNKV